MYYVAPDLVVERNTHYCENENFVESFKEMYLEEEMGLFESWHVKTHFEEELISNFVIDSFRRTILVGKGHPSVQPSALFMVREKKKRGVYADSKKAKSSVLEEEHVEEEGPLGRESILDLLVKEEEEEDIRARRSQRMSMLSDMRFTTDLNYVTRERADSLVIALPYYSIIKNSMGY